MRSNLLNPLICSMPGIACFLLSPSGAAAPGPGSPSDVETVLVEGERDRLELEKELALTPGGVTLVDSAELFERSVSNLADMFRYVPGLWVAGGSTGDSSFFSSRGSNLDATGYDGNGIKLSQDGLPITAADGNNHNRDVDPLSTRYAVVARGANALTYGASTLGGAVDFITPTARDTPSRLYLNGGSFGQLQGQLTLGAVAGEFDGLLTLDGRAWDGFRDAQHGQDRLGVYANVGWQFADQGLTRFYLNWIDNDQALPGALSQEQFDTDPYQANPNNVEGNFQLDVRSWRLANKTTWSLGEDSTLWVGFSLEEQALFHPIVYGPFFSLLIDTDQRNAGTALRYDTRIGKHELLAGINYAQTEVQGGNYSHEAGSRGALMTRVDNDAESLELFVVDRWRIAQDWTLIYGVQAVSARREVRNTAFGNGELYNPSGRYESFNPRVGVLHQLAEGVEMFANVSRLYEPPTNYELEDDAGREAGQSDALNAMRGEVVELGTRGQRPTGERGQWRWEFAAYYAELRDEILSIDDPSAPGTSLSANVDHTIHAGIEALVGGSFALGAGDRHRLEPLISYTLNAFSFDGDANYGNNELPVAPGFAIRGELLYRHAGGFFAGPTFDLIDDRYADFDNTYRVDGYSLLGLRAGYSGGSWEVFADARNLTDQDHVSVLSVRERAGQDAAILQAGEPRSLFVGITLQL